MYVETLKLVLREKDYFEKEEFIAEVAPLQ